MLNRVGIVKLLLNADATGPGTIMSSGNNLNHGFHTKKTGTVGAFSVTLEGSFDEVNWVTIATVSADNTATQATGIYPYIRANLTALAAGDTVTVMYVGR